jgi:hypothetical protein
MHGCAKTSGAGSHEQTTAGQYAMMALRASTTPQQRGNNAAGRFGNGAQHDERQ